MVLFPRVLVPLHIFEPRYRLMINECIEQSRSFGIVFIPPGSAEGESTIRSVGVAVRIVQSEKLEDGRFIILVAGDKRFRIVEFTGSQPYWSAEVEFFDDALDGPGDGEELQESCDEVVRLFRKVVEVGDVEIPKDPSTISGMVSYAVVPGLESKQELLEMRSTNGRLKSLIVYLEEEIQRMNSNRAKNIDRHWLN